MERMRLQLAAEGHDVMFAAVNKSDAVEDQAELVARTSYPLFQDLDTVGAWDLHDGHKDDIYVYDREGRLAVYLPVAGEVETDLSTAEGYENLRSAILSVVGQ